jgi:hypothetical protein
MKKVLGFLLLSSSMFSMELAHKLQTPRHRFSRVASKIMQTEKPQVACTTYKWKPTISHATDTEQVLIDAPSVHIPHNLTNVELYHGTKGFVIQQDDKQHVIEKCFMDPIARSITKEGLKPFLKMGYFVVNQTNDGTFMLKAHHRLTGGGPYFGGFMYWLTKSLCYGSLAAVAGTAVVGTGGAIIGAVAGSAVAGGTGTVTALAIAGNSTSTAVLSIAISTTIGTTIITTGGVGVGVASTATAVGLGAGAVPVALGATAAGAVATKAAVVTTGAVIASGASTGGIVVGIEALSVAVGTFFGMLPTP